MQGECKKASLLVFLPSRSHFYAKSVEMEVIFNRCWVLEIQNEVSTNQSGVDYKTYWGMWKDVTNFVASLWTSRRADCEVEAGFYEV